MALPGEKNISAFVDPKVSEKFKQQCEGQKYFKNTTLEGAIRYWLTLDRTTQGLLMEGMNPSKPENAVPADAEIYADLDSLARSVAAVTEKISRNQAARNQKKPHLRSRAKD